MRAFIYCRVSTTEQDSDTSHSLSSQEALCRDYAKREKWRIHKVRKDVGSGKTGEREGFQELLKDIDDGCIDVVIVYKLDRLSRDVRDIYGFLEKKRKSGVEFVSVTEKFDTTSEMGRAMLGIAAVFAQLTHETIAANTKAGLRRRGQEGYYLGKTDNVYGYDYDPQSRVHVINESEAPHVKQIFDWVREDHYGTQKIARLLNLSAVPAKNGGEWSHTTIQRMLRNPFLAGKIRLRDAAPRTDDGRRGYVYTYVAGKHEPIIGWDDFETAQAILKGRATIPPRSQQSPYLLSSVAKCKRCGRSLQMHQAISTRKDGPVRQRYYRHPSTAKVGPAACPGFIKLAPRLEGLVVDQIMQAARSRFFERLLIEDVKKHEGLNVAPLAKERDKLLLELDQQRKIMSKWADRVDSGLLDEDDFRSLMGDRQTRKQAMQSRLEVLNRTLGDAEQVAVTLAQVQEVMRDIEGVWGTLEQEEQREVVRLLIEYLRIDKSQIELKLVLSEPVTIVW